MRAPPLQRVISLSLARLRASILVEHEEFRERNVEKVGFSNERLKTFTFTRALRFGKSRGTRLLSRSKLPSFGTNGREKLNNIEKIGEGSRPGRFVGNEISKKNLEKIRGVES